MKIIKVSVDMTVSVFEYPDGAYDEIHNALCGYVGEGCELYERILPKRLYNNLGHVNRVSSIPGESVCVLVDEEGRLKGLNPNPVGCYLYESDIHGVSIVGDIVFVGQKRVADGIEFCGIEDSVCEKLQLQLRRIICSIKWTMGKAVEDDKCR